MSFSIPNRIRSLLLADTPSLSMQERWRAALGALLAVGLGGVLLRWLPGSAYWLMAPVGASVVILFTLSHSPLAQPWPVIGGYAVATAASLVSLYLIPEPILATAMAVALTVWLMARLNCIHPPGGALAMLLMHEPRGSAGPLAHTVVMIGLNVIV
ncbi:MAG TPA: HPP family protein, partial [Aquabacterium sp.]|nr:HPP family protein [Aquabacterium sp.]